MSTTWLPRLLPLCRGSWAPLPRRASSQTAKSSATPTPAELWDIAVSVCVERHPRVTPPLAELPKTFLTCLRQQEIEQSLLNDHELAIQREARAKSAVDASLQKREAGLKTTLDLEDDWQKEMAQFPLPPRDPEARGTPHEPAPTLTRPVVLMVRHLRGATPVWTLPMAQRLAGETLRQTAERAVLDNVGSRLQVQILGLAPWAVYNNRYSKTMQGHCGKMGSKVRHWECSTNGLGMKFGWWDMSWEPPLGF